MAHKHHEHDQQVEKRAREFFDSRTAERVAFHAAKKLEQDPAARINDNPDNPVDPPPHHPTRPPTPAPTYRAVGTIGCGGILFYGSINCDFAFDDGTRMDFQAEIGGLVPTPFSSTGGVAFFNYTPQQLKDMEWIGVTVVFGPGFLHVMWNKDGRDVGSATGGGLVAVPGGAGGSGNFYYV
jgi:hypothetical protein